MEEIKLYCKEHIAGMLIFAVSAVVYAVVFGLYGFSIEVVIYPTVIILIIGTVIMVLTILRDRKRHLTIEAQAEKSAYLNTEELPAPFSLIENDYLKIIALLKEELVRRDCENDDKNRNMTDYYTMWVHQIKTPIASMKLKLSETDSESSRLIAADLRRIEQYVDMVLTYFRLNADSTDYVFKKVGVDSIIKPAVRKFSHDFISRKLSLKYEASDKSVLTDSKWLGFVIEQLLSNAVKYTKEGGVTIDVGGSDNSTVITIEDTGIGIPSENLPRIFEPGFTGFNGRTDSHSSGIGLYICKKICDNLGVDIDVASKVGEGTKFMLTIDDSKYKYE